MEQACLDPPWVLFFSSNGPPVRSPPKGIPPRNIFCPALEIGSNADTPMLARQLHSLREVTPDSGKCTCMNLRGLHVKGQHPEQMKI